MSCLIAVHMIIVYVESTLGFQKSARGQYNLLEN